MYNNFDKAVAHFTQTLGRSRFTPQFGSHFRCQHWGQGEQFSTVASGKPLQIFQAQCYRAFNIQPDTLFSSTFRSAQTKFLSLPLKPLFGNGQTKRDKKNSQATDMTKKELANCEQFLNGILALTSNSGATVPNLQIALDNDLRCNTSWTDPTDDPTRLKISL
eukprot:jgi/Psemu1/33971/gm1.33971_g